MEACSGLIATTLCSVSESVSLKAAAVDEITMGPVPMVLGLERRHVDGYVMPVRDMTGRVTSLDIDLTGKMVMHTTPMGEVLDGNGMAADVLVNGTRRVREMPDVDARTDICTMLRGHGVEEYLSNDTLPLWQATLPPRPGAMPSSVVTRTGPD